MKVKQNKRLMQIASILAIIMTIIALQFGVSKYLINNEKGTQLNFYEYRISPSEILISPETYTGEEVIVTIATDTEKAGLSIQYQLGDNSEWINYVGPFAVQDNTEINARLVSDKDYFKGPITNKAITNIAVAKIGDEYFKTLAEAIEACPENATDSQTKIEMLTNVTESAVIPEGKNVLLDLCGNTVTSAEESTIAVNGKLNLVDSISDGKLESTVGTAIYVGLTGSCSIGTNESVPVVSKTELAVVGETYGVVVEEGGVLGFYDGEARGKINAINGTVAVKPEGYDIITSIAGEYEVARLEEIFIVTFDANGGTGSFDSKTVIFNKPYGELPTAERIGYTFAGWSTSVETDNFITQLTIVEIEQNHTITAKWIPNSYNIAYNNNTGVGEIESTLCTYDAEATIATPTEENITKTGYTFKNWNTNSDGTGTTYEAGQIVKNLTNVNNETITLYAIWHDTIAPSKVAPTGVGTTNSITVNCNQTDDGSGIDSSTIEYAIYKDGAWSEWQSSNIFQELITNTDY